MKILEKTKVVLFAIFMAFGVSLNAQDFTEITNSLKSGDVGSLAVHIDSNIDLTILDNEDSYSKKQIESILKDFFSKNRPSDYKLIHKGNSGNGAFFQIGELTTSTDIFRTYLYAKNINGKFLIQEFRIEEN